MKSQKLGFMSRLLCKWKSQATLIGTALMPVLLVIRLVTLGLAGQTAWGDEQEFICNTEEEGCNVACYSACTPLSPTRLWTLQLVLVLAPGLVFLCYLIHLTNQENKGDVETKGHTLAVYLTCMAFVILVEVGCVIVQYVLYGFRMSGYYVCQENPCPHRVDCTIPHAREKTVFMCLMFTTSCVSMLLSAVEGVCVLLRAKPWHRKPGGAKAHQSGSEVEERCFLAQLLALSHSHASLLGKTVLPVLQLIRLVIVGAAVRPVWHQELRNFVCDNRQKGCSQNAYSIIFPFTAHQYWTLQVVLILAPGLIFFSYLVHVIVTEQKKHPGACIAGCVLGAYLGHLLAVLLLEVAFAAGQAVIFGFSLSPIFTAETYPCSFRVNCYFPMAKEKTAFMVIMFSLACLSALLTLVEMCIVLKSERPWEKRQNNMTSEAPGIQLRAKEEADTTEDNEHCIQLNIISGK